MASRKKSTNTKAAKAAQASTDDQPKADTVTQAGAGANPAPAQDKAEDATPAPAAKEPEPAKEPEDAGTAISASPEPASETDKPAASQQSDVGAAKPVAAPEASASDDHFAAAGITLEGIWGQLVELAERLSRLETQFEGADQALTFYGNAETRDPTPDPLDDVGPENLEVTVVGPAKGFWRAGRKFGPEPVVIPASELTGHQFKALEDDPVLTVKVDKKAVALSAE